jgi:hypothetical protein
VWARRRTREMLVINHCERQGIAALLQRTSRSAHSRGARRTIANRLDLVTARRVHDAIKQVVEAANVSMRARRARKYKKKSIRKYCASRIPSHTGLHATVTAAPAHSRI